MPLGNVVARGFNRFVNFFTHKQDVMDTSRAKATTALTRDMNAALAQWEATGESSAEYPV